VVGQFENVVDGGTVLLEEVDVFGGDFEPLFGEVHHLLVVTVDLGFAELVLLGEEVVAELDGVEGVHDLELLVLDDQQETAFLLVDLVDLVQRVLVEDTHLLLVMVLYIFFLF